MTNHDAGHDPRLDGPSLDLALANAEAAPTVGQAPGRRNTALVVAAFGLCAVLLFAWMNARRLAEPADSLVTAPPGAAMVAVAPPPPLAIVPVTAGPQDLALGLTPATLGAISTVPVPILSAPGPTSAPAFVVATGPGQGDLLARRRAPAIVVDFGAAPKARAAGVALAQAAAGETLPAAAGAAEPTGPKLNDDEQFSARVGEGDAPERARATSMGALDTLVSQGTVIPAVLETAINSDLPGYTRAVVSRGVRSFDGKSVLIPRGSRLIGQYKSAVALGQSRAFVIWTRVIRPDGVSIQIGSPGTDALGRGGLKGDVNRHFFQRFGGSILLSVLNAGVASLGDTPSTQISIGSPGAAAGAAASALQGEAVSPTIKVAQGEAIRIFVTRDLDFSGVGPAK